MTTWDQALGRYAAQRGERVAAATLRAQMTRLRRLASDIGRSPADVTAAHFDDWIGSLECTLAVTAEYVTAARDFYRWAVRAGITTASPVPERAVRRTYTLDDRWLTAVESFERAQIAAHAAPGTTRRRLQHLRRFAATIDLDPWHVQPEDYGAWIAEKQSSDTVRAAARDSLRAFYRWAVSAGRIAADPTAEPSGRGRKLGIPELWERDIHAWRRWMIAAGHSQGTVTTRIECVSTLARAYANASPWDITGDDLADYVAGKRWARETRRGFRVTVRSFFGWAITSGRAEMNPAETMPKVRAGDPSRRPATEAEYLTALGRVSDDRLRLALRMSRELGLRRGEIARAHSRDAVEAHGHMTLTVHGKGGKVRHVPVPDNLAAAIRAAGDGYLLPSPAGGHLTARYVGRRVSRVLPPGITMHALRHAFATRAYNVNRDVFTVQRLLGHASAATTQRYVQVSDESMRALVEAVAL